MMGVSNFTTESVNREHDSSAFQQPPSINAWPARLGRNAAAAAPLPTPASRQLLQNPQTNAQVIFRQFVSEQACKAEAETFQIGTTDQRPLRPAGSYCTVEPMGLIGMIIVFALLIAAVALSAMYVSQNVVTYMEQQYPTPSYVKAAHAAGR